MSGRGQFEVRIGTTIKLVSGLATLLLIGMAFGFWRLAHGVALPLSWLAWALLALPPACLIYTVRGYRIDGRTLYVRRLLHETAIDLQGLRSVERLPKAFAGSVRVFGNGGLYSFSGWFWRRGMGRFKAYAMDLGPGLMLRWEARAVLLTPVEIDAMTTALSAQILPRQS